MIEGANQHQSPVTSIAFSYVVKGAQPFSTRTGNNCSLGFSRRNTGKLRRIHRLRGMDLHGLELWRLRQVNTSVSDLMDIHASSGKFRQSSMEICFFAGEVWFQRQVTRSERPNSIFERHLAVCGIYVGARSHRISPAPCLPSIL